MSIRVERYISVNCDGCDAGYDEMGNSAAEEFNKLKELGWTGTIRKCYCPICSFERRVARIEGGKSKSIKVLDRKQDIGM